MDPAAPEERNIRPCFHATRRGEIDWTDNAAVSQETSRAVVAGKGLSGRLTRLSMLVLVAAATPMPMPLFFLRIRTGNRKEEPRQDTAVRVRSGNRQQP